MLTTYTPADRSNIHANRFPHFQIEKIEPAEDPGLLLTSFKENRSCFRLIWVTSGEGNFWIDMRQYVIGANFLFFIRPGQVYTMERGNPLEGYIISFTGSFLGMDDERSDSQYTGNLLGFFSQQVIQIDCEAVTDIKETLDKMIKEQYNVHAFRIELLKRYFKIFLIYLTRQFEEIRETGLQTKNVEYVKRFMALVDKDFKEKKMVADYALDLYLTPNYLNQIVKKVTGHSAGHHIRQRIILEAKRKAVYSDKSMKEIAYTLGFTDIAHFSKLFKKIAGVNFVDFKRDKLPVPYIPEMGIA
jgi:AraC-like DNA-binding protein/mannose-6-phosphate isomerase-like protein (cupin superfamily)